MEIKDFFMCIFLHLDLFRPSLFPLSSLRKFPRNVISLFATSSAHRRDAATSAAVCGVRFESPVALCPLSFSPFSNMVSKRVQTALAVLLPGLLLAKSGVQRVDAQVDAEDLLRLNIPNDCPVQQEQTNFQMTEFTGVPFNATCQRYCAEHPECAAFTYHADSRRCVLHSRTGNLAEKATARFSRKRCPTCLLDNFNVADTEDDYLVIAMTVQGCASECRTRGCNFYVYDKESKKCHFKRHRDGIQSAIRPQQGLQVGFHNCRNTDSWCFAPNHTLQGETLKTTTASGPLHCSEICLNHAGCAAFSFDVGSKACHLKPASAFDHVAPQNGSFFGPPGCGLPPACETQGKRRAGDFLMSFSPNSIKTNKGCQRRCQENHRCFHYSFGPEGCFLHGLGSVAEDVEGYISGDTNCGI
uniref:PAN domain-containing protein n=1 Tax=Toxoplasma gondii COUG TaxID=1074873 RepID=A0A2G8Y7C4_TOXGO|nr:PAN domain-containing protein [Toxoplasma gondii COUG]